MSDRVKYDEVFLAEEGEFVDGDDGSRWKYQRGYTEVGEAALVAQL